MVKERKEFEKILGASLDFNGGTSISRLQSIRIDRCRYLNDVILKCKKMGMVPDDAWIKEKKELAKAVVYPEL